MKFKIAAFLLLLGLPSCLIPPDSELLFSSRRTLSENSLSESAEKLQIWYPYVGQGDAALLILPNHKNLLLDAGPPGAGKTYLLPFLESLGIQSLDAIVLSHYDADHLGGIPEVLLGLDGVAGTADDIQVHAIYDRGGEAWDPGPAYANYLLALEKSAIPRRALAAGDSMALDADLLIRCVAANGVVDGGEKAPVAVDFSPKSYAGKENAASLALMIEYGNFRYLSAGDLTGGGMSNGFLTPDVETPLAQAIGQVDALHVNHHGSASSSNETFVHTTRPRMAIIQAGDPSPYGHPHPEVLSRWASISAEIHLVREGEALRLSAYPDGRVEVEHESIISD